MNKKVLIILLTLCLLFLIIIYSNFSKKNENNVNIFDSLKKDCLLSPSLSGKYFNSVYDLEFDYPDYLSICEKYVFNTKKQGLEIYIWDKNNFESSNAISNPRAIFYINKSLTLNDDLMNLYNMEDFEEKNISNNKIILAKEIKQLSCFKDECKFNIYKFSNNDLTLLIKEYKEINVIINSLNTSSF